MLHCVALWCAVLHCTVLRFVVLFKTLVHVWAVNAYQIYSHFLHIVYSLLHLNNVQ